MYAPDFYFYEICGFRSLVIIEKKTMGGFNSALQVFSYY